MKLEQFWNQFLENRPDLTHLQETIPEAWRFGGNADHLLSLVMEGKKTATCSLMSVYENGTEKLPVVGSYHVILVSHSVPRCVISIEETFQRKFREIDEQHAFEEGEGDRSLNHWRKVHLEFFSRYEGFSEDSEVLCERFRLVWP